MLIVDALRCQNNSGRPPVWLMRQAGRYMPDYQQLRKNHTLDALFHNPELAAEITLLPEKLLQVDALVIFSDILMLCEMIGLKVTFQDGVGPIVIPQLSTAADVENLILKPASQTVPFVAKTIELLKQQTATPLLGFCGAPFTIASYLFGSVEKALNFASQHNKIFHALLDKLAIAGIDLLKLQIDAGVSAVQLFDSWGGTLSYTNFLQYSHLYMQKIAAAMRAIDIPLILFTRNSSLYPRELSAINPAAISYDNHRSMKELRLATPSHIAIQGNLDNIFLRDASTSQIKQATQALLSQVGHEKGVVLNLAHGVLPQTPVDNVRAFVDTIKNFSAVCAS